MGFLKRLGMIGAEGLRIALGVAPYAAPILDRLAPGTGAQFANVVNELKAVAGVVQTIEIAAAAATAGGTPVSGPQKLLMAAPLVEQIILSSDMLAKHKIVDKAKFKAGVEKITAGVADVLSSLNDDVTTTDKT